MMTGIPAARSPRCHRSLHRGPPGRGPTSVCWARSHRQEACPGSTRVSSAYSRQSDPSAAFMVAMTHSLVHHLGSESPDRPPVGVDRSVGLDEPHDRTDQDEGSREVPEASETTHRLGLSASLVKFARLAGGEVGHHEANDEGQQESEATAEPGALVSLHLVMNDVVPVDTVDAEGDHVEEHRQAGAAYAADLPGSTDYGVGAVGCRQVATRRARWWCVIRLLRSFVARLALVVLRHGDSPWSGVLLSRHRRAFAAQCHGKQPLGRAQSLSG